MQLVIFPHISSLNQAFSPATFPEMWEWSKNIPPNAVCGVEQLCLRLRLYPHQYDTFIVLPKLSEDAVIFTVNARLRKSSISRQNDHPFLPNAHPQGPGSINCTGKKRRKKKPAAKCWREAWSRLFSIPCTSHALVIFQHSIVLMADSFTTDAVCTRRNALNRDKEPATATQHAPNMFQSDMGSS